MVKKEHNLDRSAASCLNRIREILRYSRSKAMQSINTAMVEAYWQIGREIVVEEQRGKERADYGTRLLREISKRLTSEFGKGFSERNLRFIRQFYLTYKNRSPVSQSRQGPEFKRNDEIFSHGERSVSRLLRFSCVTSIRRRSVPGRRTSRSCGHTSFPRHPGNSTRAAVSWRGDSAGSRSRRLSLNTRHTSSCSSED